MKRSASEPGVNNIIWLYFVIIRFSSYSAGTSPWGHPGRESVSLYPLTYGL